MMYDWDWQGADDAMQRALELEPGNVHVLNGASALAAVLGRLDEAINLDRRVIALDPLRWQTYSNFALNLTASGQLDEAAAAFRHVLELNPQAPGIRFLLGRIFLLQHRPQMANAESAAYHIATIHAWRGDADEAFVWLDIAYEQRDSFLPELLSDPLLPVSKPIHAGLRSSTRWGYRTERSSLVCRARRQGRTLLRTTSCDPCRDRLSCTGA